MKHIKHIRESFNKNDYYVNIPERVYDKLVYDGDNENVIYPNGDAFTTREVNFINNLVSEKDYLRIGSWEKKDGNRTDNFDESVSVHLYYRSNNKYGFFSDNIFITKITDGYFIINFCENINDLSKCDGLEGLIEFLKDKNIL